MCVLEQPTQHRCVPMAGRSPVKQLDLTFCNQYRGVKVTECPTILPVTIRQSSVDFRPFLGGWAK